MEMKIEWETDFDNAVAKAKAENKMIFLDFYNPQ
jgi:hypothetical protein